jgi:hypothetical protein
MRRELLTALARRHGFSKLGAANPVNQLALVRMASDYRSMSVSIGKEIFLHVEAKVCLALLLVGTVALKTIIGEDGPDFATEQDVLASAEN